jgi:hypothetical protein
VKVNVSQAWKPMPGHHYAMVDVTMNDDFVRTDPRLWGVVEWADSDQLVSIDVLRIHGRLEWFARFDEAATEEYGSWKTHLAGNGNYTALSGVHVINGRFHIGRLEVYGLPGAGIYFQNCATAQIDSGLFYRVGWPVVQDWQAIPNARLCGITSVDNWSSRKWPGGGDTRQEVALRRFHPQGIGCRGETVTSGSQYIVEYMVKRGDGTSIKACGNRYIVRHCHLGQAFFAGTPPSNLVNPIFQGHENVLHAYQVLVEDCVFTGQPVNTDMQAIVYISHPFEDVPVFRDCTFIRGAEPAAVQQNYNRIRYERCHFIGWGTDWKTAFQLSPSWTEAGVVMPAATIEDGGGNVGWAS